ncbi:hypothetical protein AALP_AA5G000400 [Arabis alpina]|uniref:Complex III subunit VI n=1 Tax=Arabis alpina TaxID=50452 RepID=A0A087GTX9_ARAAL|nr:hypothetical protein AALP_AA5G000400 [Arabis alpina]
MLGIEESREEKLDAVEKNRVVGGRRLREGRKVGIEETVRKIEESIAIVKKDDDRNRIETFRVHRSGHLVPLLTSLWYHFSLRFRVRSFLSNFAMADEEAVDQKKCLEESCKPKCVKPLLDYQACVKRIQDDESGQKHCTGQYFDYWHCVDKCVGPKLFAKLK